MIFDQDRGSGDATATATANDGDDDLVAGQDLVVLAVGGVQSFISASRTTSDLRSASQIMSRLASAAVGAFITVVGADVVMPAIGARPGRRSAGQPNRVVALVPVGEGVRAAQAARAAVADSWAELVSGVMGRDVEASEWPGIPEVMWVVAGPGAGKTYAARWEAARGALGARKRTRVFPGYERRRREVCGLSPAWAATARPVRARAHDEDTLSGPGWVKRCYRDVERLPGFPSTSSIASAPYRAAVLEHWSVAEVRASVSALRDVAEQVRSVLGVSERAVEGLPTPAGEDDEVARWFRAQAGPWVYGEAWEPARLARALATDPGTRSRAAVSSAVVAQWCSEASQALAGLTRALATHGVSPRRPTPYLAAVAQDVDGMGRLMSGQAPGQFGVDAVSISPGWHRERSAELMRLGSAQSEAIAADHLGAAVYAGGDDLLVLTPVGTALAAAGSARRLVDDHLVGFAADPTASTAVVFFHMHSPLQQAIRAVHDLVEKAKSARPEKNVLAVAARRRGGERSVCLQRWQVRDTTTPDSADLVLVSTVLDRLRPVGLRGRGMSPRLASTFEQDRTELRLLGQAGKDGERAFDLEVNRLVARHGGTPAQAQALRLLARHELSDRGGRPARTFNPGPAALIARFLQQEGQ